MISITYATNMNHQIHFIILTIFVQVLSQYRLPLLGIIIMLFLPCKALGVSVQPHHFLTVFFFSACLVQIFAQKSENQVINLLWPYLINKKKTNVSAQFTKSNHDMQRLEVEMQTGSYSLDCSLADLTWLEFSLAWSSLWLT